MHTKVIGDAEIICHIYALQWDNSQNAIKNVKNAHVAKSFKKNTCYQIFLSTHLTHQMANKTNTKINTYGACQWTIQDYKNV